LREDIGGRVRSAIGDVRSAIADRDARLRVLAGPNRFGMNWEK